MAAYTISKKLMSILVILIIGLVLLPVMLVFWISVFSTKFISFPPEGYSFKWYAALLKAPNFLDAAFLSVQVALITMTISVVIGMAGSLALVSMRRGREALQTLFLSPMAVPSIAIGIAVYVTFTQFERVFMVNLVPSMWLLVLTHITVSIPMSIRLISSGLAGVSKSLEEAALNLGASRFTAFVRVVFPQIRPTLIAAAIFSFIGSLGNLEISLMLVSPGHNLLPIETLNYILWEMDPTIAALSSVQVALVLLLLLITDRVVGLSIVF
jgi:putative spermidine/putrescine transport system permease protein